MRAAASKSDDNVIAFPVRGIDPSWRNWLREENARVERRQRVHRAFQWIAIYAVLSAIGALLGWLSWLVL